MKLNLNVWQRALLLVAAAGIASAAAWHGFEFGFEGLDWVLAFVTAAMMAFFALSGESKKTKSDTPEKAKLPKKETPSASKVLEYFQACNAKISDLMPKQKLSDDAAEPFDPTFLSESLFGIRSAVYAYIIAVIAAQKIDSAYLSSASFKEVTRIFDMLIEKLWVHRLGEGTTMLPSDDGAKDEIAKLRIRAEELLSMTLMKLAKKDVSPFDALYRYIEMKPNAAADALQTKYEMTTRALIDGGPFGLKQNSRGAPPLVVAPDC